MRVRKLVSVIALSLAVVAGPSLAAQDIEKVSGGITAEAGQEYGSLESVNGGITVNEGAVVDQISTVNGGVTIAARARVGEAETVNGGISVGTGASVASLEAVNGGLDVAPGVQIERSAETVNGGIRIDTGSRVGGDVGNVNGAITLMGAEVGGDVASTNGDILLARGAVVHGGIRVEKQRSEWWMIGSDRKPRVVIGADCVVHGTLVFEREVELFVHATAKIGPVTGATAQTFTDSLPPRE